MAKTITAPAKAPVAAPAKAPVAAPAPAKAPVKPGPVTAPQVAAPAEASVEEAEEKGKPEHPLIGTEGQGYPFEALPADFKHDDFKQLKVKDFASEKAYCEYKASFFRWKADGWDKKAIVASAGTPDERKKVKQVSRWAEKLAEIAADLPEGTDVNAVLAQFGLSIAGEKK
ncbi:MAG: hypothetical protein E6Q97_07650 [Desulfurellales bacterium]|nr:MAG: hypothetical protein E6Q97_07650 [Desulfurellales bacterium]